MYARVSNSSKVNIWLPTGHPPSAKQCWALSINDCSCHLKLLATTQKGKGWYVLEGYLTNFPQHLTPFLESRHCVNAICAILCSHEVHAWCYLCSRVNRTYPFLHLVKTLSLVNVWPALCCALCLKIHYFEAHFQNWFCRTSKPQEVCSVRLLWICFLYLIWHSSFWNVTILHIFWLCYSWITKDYRVINCSL